MLKPIYEVQNSSNVIIRVTLVSNHLKRVAEVAAFMHHKNCWDIIDRNPFFLEKGVLLAYISPADLNLLTFLSRVDL